MFVREPVSYPGVGQRSIAVLCVELEGDKGHVKGDSGDHSLHCLVLIHIHVLKGVEQENHLI